MVVFSGTSHALNLNLWRSLLTMFSGESGGSRENVTRKFFIKLHTSTASSTDLLHCQTVFQGRSVNQNPISFKTHSQYFIPVHSLSWQISKRVLWWRHFMCRLCQILTTQQGCYRRPGYWNDDNFCLLWLINSLYNVIQYLYTCTPWLVCSLKLLLLLY